MVEADVYIDCGNARRRASELRGQAGQIRELLGSYQNTMSRIESSWKGSGSWRYRQSLEGRTASLKRSAERLDELASAIEQTASIYQRQQISMIQEQRALEAAQRVAQG